MSTAIDTVLTEAPSSTHVSDSNEPTHTISIPHVPRCVLDFIRQNAEKSGLPRRHYLIQLFAASTPIAAQMQPGQAGNTTLATQAADNNQATHTISVQKVPHIVWTHVRHNAMLSKRSFSSYLIELLEQSSPLPITLGSSVSPQ